VDDNIAEIVGLRGNTGTPFPHGVWLDKVRPGGDWDYKLQNPDPSYQDFGNFNYGATGRALGLSEDTLLRGAGAAQMLGGAYDTAFGTPLGGPPHGDDPRDQFWIREGIRYYENTWGGSP
jgi:Bacterial toxin 44